MFGSDFFSIINLLIMDDKVYPLKSKMNQKFAKI